jgi:hypothetical protein
LVFKLSGVKTAQKEILSVKGEKVKFTVSPCFIGVFGALSRNFHADFLLFPVRPYFIVWRLFWVVNLPCQTIKMI